MRLIDADVIISQCKEYSNLLKYDGTTDREWALVKRMILMINEQPTIEPEREEIEALKGIALELLEKYKISGLSAIWEISTHIEQDETNFLDQIERYMERILDITENIK